MTTRLQDYAQFIGARNQGDIVKAQTGNTGLKTDNLNIPISSIGFTIVEQGTSTRMDVDNFKLTARTILKARSTAHIIEVKPTVPYKERIVVSKSQEVFKMSITSKVDTLAHSWVRYQDMAGFRIELHDVSTQAGVGSDKSSGSIVIYLADEPDDSFGHPLDISITYRPIGNLI